MIAQIQWTTSSLEEAKKIATALLEKKWIACVNLIPQVISMYYWEGKLQEDREVKVIFKACEKRFQDICQYIVENAKYDVAEVSMIPLSACNPLYKDWVVASCK